jgi:glyoxylase-like metal-dependent hydrolase (beta-lactamase superfamily II)
MIDVMIRLVGLLCMSLTKVEEHIHLIDAETAGIKGFIASYVLKGRQVAMVETGPASSVPNLLAGLEKLNVELADVAYVAVSHIHLDHAGGAGTLLKHLPNAKVIVHPRGASHLAHPEKLWEQSKLVLGSITEMYGEPEPIPEDRIIAASDGMTFDLGGGVELKVVETLGHASHHQSYYEKLSQGVFPGDAAGIYLGEINKIVPTTPPPLRLDIALSSLGKLINLKPRNLYYSHFGKAINGVEKLNTYVRQLKLWEKIAKQGIDNGEGLAAISKHIIENDDSLRRALDYVRAHPVLGETVLTNSVQGVVDFVEKFGVT